MTMKVFKSEAARAQVLESYDRLVHQTGITVHEKDIQTPYGATHILLAGSEQNPPLMLFHGVGDNSAVMWVLNLKQFSEHFYCIAVDTLGGPGKSVPRDGLTKKTFDQVAWINCVAESLGLDRFYIAGVSNGACMAYNYTVKQSKRVIRAVCMEGGMIINPVRSMFMTLMLLFPEIFVPTRNNMTKILIKMSTPYSDIYDKHPEIVDHMIMVMKAHNQKAMFIHKLEKYSKQEGMAVKEKLLFLLGGYRTDSNSSYIEMLKDGGYNYKIIKNAGHGINHDQPEEINREIQEFLLAPDKIRQ